MKLSDIKGERTLDVIAELIDPIANIAEDDSACELFSRKSLPPGMTPKSFLLKRARKSIPILLQAHKTDIITILSSIEGISPESYVESMNLVKLAKDFIDLVTDETFHTLFISAQNAESSSGSAPENIVALEA